MLDDLIDDEVRRSFPGKTDEEIQAFYDVAISVRPLPAHEIFESDLSHARIIRELGWDAFKEYLRVTTGTDTLDDGDIVALVEACEFLREIENTSLYAAIYGAASEGHKKTLSARKESFSKLTSSLKNIEITKGI